MRSAVNRCSNALLAHLLRSMPAAYVALLDGDDYWTSPQKLKQQIAFLDANQDCSICFHNVSVVDHDTSHPPRLFNAADQPRRSRLEDLLRRNFIAGCAALIRAD